MKAVRTVLMVMLALGVGPQLKAEYTYYLYTWNSGSTLYGSATVDSGGEDTTVSASAEIYSPGPIQETWSSGCEWYSAIAQVSTAGGTKWGGWDVRGTFWWLVVSYALSEAVEYANPVTNYVRTGWVPDGSFTVSYYDENCPGQTGGIEPAACDEGATITYADPFPPNYLQKTFLAWKFLNQPYACFSPSTVELANPAKCIEGN